MISRPSTSANNPPMLDIGPTSYPWLRAAIFTINLLITHCKWAFLSSTEILQLFKITIAIFTCRSEREWHRCACGHQRSWWQSWLRPGSGCRCVAGWRRIAHRTSRGRREPAPWSGQSSPGPCVQGPWPCRSWKVDNEIVKFVFCSINC